MIGKVIRVIEKYESPEKPGLVEVEINQPLIGLMGKIDLVDGPRDPREMFPSVRLSDILPAPTVVWESEGEYKFDVGYGVPLERCSTAAELVEWIAHLSEKTWFTTRHVMQLVALVEKRHPGVRAYGC